MNTLPFTPCSLNRRAFTLIELLVVITIIAVLAGLLLPVTQRVLENSRKVTAKNTEAQIVAAVNSYQTDYGQYPVYVGNNATPMDTTFGVDSGDNKTLFNVLRALNANDANTKTLNTRQSVYFESKNVKNAGNPRDGFVVTTPAKGNKDVTLNTGDLVDPWGNLYLVRIDTNYTNAVLNPYANASANANDDAATSSDPTSADYKKVLRTGVIAWTWGNDGVLGPKPSGFAAPYTPTPGDDVVSWQ